MPKSEKERLARDAKRDLGKELLQSVKEMRARKKGRASKVTVSWVIEVRMRTGLSQSAFADLLGVSVRTLQDWEQGRREPSGAAKSLLKIAKKHPETLVELAA